MEISQSFINENNINEITLGYWPRKLVFTSVDRTIINWFNRIIKFNLESRFIRASAKGKKGRNLLHVHPLYPGYDVIITSIYEFEGNNYELDYKYKQNSHYVHTRNFLCPINLNDAWKLVNSSSHQLNGFKAFDHAFKASFSSINHEPGIHRGYGIGSDVYEFIQSPAFKSECFAAIELEASKSNKIKYSFKRSLASLDIDKLSNSECISVIKSAANISSILLAHKWSPHKMLDFLKKASLNTVDAQSLTEEDMEEIRAIRSIKHTHL